MHTLTQLLIGTAAAGLVAGPQRPGALIIGAVAGVLPDLLDWWSRQLHRQPDITVTPDPLAPTPATMAQGVRLALQQMRIRGTPCVVRLNPLPAPAAGYISYCLDLDQRHRLVVALDSGGRFEPIDLPGKDGTSTGYFAPQHPLPLRITDTPVDLQFRAIGKRIESRDLARVAGVGHALPVAGVVAGVVGVLGNCWLGLAAAAALTAHLLLDAGSRREIAFGLPFSHHVYHGRRIWNECGWRANLVLVALAGGVIMGVVLAACRT